MFPPGAGHPDWLPAAVDHFQGHCVPEQRIKRMFSSCPHDAEYTGLLAAVRAKLTQVATFVMTVTDCGHLLPM